jgi:protein disulfide-isomerase-like protein
LVYVRAEEGSSIVRALTAADFHQVVDGSLPAFVEFYAPWCGHCKRLAPEYELVAESFKSYSSQVVVAKVDCDAEKTLCSEQGVSGYPTLKWFPKGSPNQPDSYSGGRSAEDIINFINEKAGLNARLKKPATKVVDLSDANFDKVVLESNKYVFVKFYAPWCGHCKSLAPVWDKLANVFAGDSDKVVIAKLDADKYRALGEKYDVSGFPTLIFFDKKNVKDNYQGERDLKSLVDYVNEKAGTERLESGLLNEKAGLIEAFNEVTSSFLDGDHESLISKAKSIAEQLTDEVEKKAAAIYVKLLDKIKADKNYIESEVSRLTRMLSGSSLNQAKIDEFTRRINVLKSFKQE